MTDFKKHDLISNGLVTYTVKTVHHNGTYTVVGDRWVDANGNRDFKSGCLMDLTYPHITLDDRYSIFDKGDNG